MGICIYVVFAILRICTDFFLDDVNFEVLDHVILLLTAVSFWVIVSSRCFAPCCCVNKTPDVPEPCPIGRCAPNNPKVLDYPLVVLFAGQGWVGIFEAMLMYLLATDKDLDLDLVRLLRLVWLLVALVGLCTGIMKWKLM